MGPICIPCAAESLQLESESGFRRIEADHFAEERVGSMEILEHVTHIGKYRLHSNTRRGILSSLQSRGVSAAKRRVYTAVFQYLSIIIARLKDLFPVTFQKRLFVPALFLAQYLCKSKTDLADLSNCRSIESKSAPSK
jgi:hypothetical protein